MEPDDAALLHLDPVGYPGHAHLADESHRGWRAHPRRRAHANQQHLRALWSHHYGRARAIWEVASAPPRSGIETSITTLDMQSTSSHSTPRDWSGKPETEAENRHHW